MVRSGRFVSQFISPCDPDQIQPNGVDLRAEALFRVRSPGALLPEGTQLGDREPVPWTEGEPLPAGPYVVAFREKVRIPDEHVGVLFPRSSLLRNGATLFSALWDQGFEGRGEALLVLWHPLVLPPNCRIGQLVLMRADAAEGYRGQWQGRGL